MAWRLLSLALKGRTLTATFTEAPAMSPWGDTGLSPPPGTPLPPAGTPRSRPPPAQPGRGRGEGAGPCPTLNPAPKQSPKNKPGAVPGEVVMKESPAQPLPKAQVGSRRGQRSGLGAQGGIWGSGKRKIPWLPPPFPRWFQGRINST